MDTIRKVLETPVVPPSKIRRETPAELEKVILKALEKDKANRYPAATQFVTAPSSMASPIFGIGTTAIRSSP